MWTFRRFGIAPLIGGIILMPFAIVLVRRLPKEGDAWLVLTFAVAMLMCAGISVLYDWRIDHREKQRDDPSYPA